MPELLVSDESEQCLRYASEIRQVISALIQRNIYSRAELAQKTDLKEHTIAQFILRVPDKPKYSFTLSRLYRFLTEEFDADLISEDKEAYANMARMRLSRKTIDSYANILFKGVVDYTGSSLDSINRVCAKYNGIFYIYRRSILGNRIVKTKIEIFPDESVSKMWRFSQEYKDTMGNVRKSSGIISVNSGNVYCMGRIDRGSGLDMIVFKEPVVQNQSTLQALVLTLDTNLQPVFAKAVVRSSISHKEEPFGAFDEKDIEEETKSFENLLGYERAISLDII